MALVFSRSRSKVYRECVSPLWGSLGSAAPVLVPSFSLSLSLSFSHSLTLSHSLSPPRWRYVCREQLSRRVKYFFFCRRYTRFACARNHLFSFEKKKPLLFQDNPFRCWRNQFLLRSPAYIREYATNGKRSCVVSPIFRRETISRDPRGKRWRTTTTTSNDDSFSREETAIKSRFGDLVLSILLISLPLFVFLFLLLLLFYFFLSIDTWREHSCIRRIDVTYLPAERKRRDNTMHSWYTI